MRAVESVLDSGQYILGEEVARFEKEFAAYCGTRFSVGVSNGTSALYLVLKAWGIGPGDEVITSPNSFVASAASIALVGAKPVFADIGSDMNIRPDLLERAVTPRTKALMPVHLSGRPAKMDEILKIARKHKIKVLEDAAQSVGASLNGKRVGSFGDASCFSLHPLKNLHAFGDGGMITTHDPSLFEYLKKSRNHGLANRDTCDFWSFNCRLDEMQAAMLRVQLRLLDQQTKERRRLAFRYNKALKNCVGVPEEDKGEFCVYQTYMIRAKRRDDLQKYLKEEGIQTSTHYAVSIPFQPAAKALGYTRSDLPRTVLASEEILSLPIYPGMTLRQQDAVIRHIIRFTGQPTSKARA